MNDDPEPYWIEFLAAAEASAIGNHALAIALVQKHPIVRGELKAFVGAIRSGRLEKRAGKWRVAQGGSE
jgi:hypothetical protein